MGLRQPRANVNYNKKIKKKLDRRFLTPCSLFAITYCNATDLLLMGMNTYSLFNRGALKNFSADVKRTILKLKIIDR